MKYYTTGYQSFVVNHASGDANEAANGDMFVDRDYVTLGYESGTPVGAQKAFFRFELTPEQAVEISGKTILPESYIVFPLISGYDVPFSGKMYCELAASSDIMAATNGAISARTKTTDYFELGSEQFSGSVYSHLNDNIVSYWDFDNPLGYVPEDGGNHNSGVYPDRIGNNNLHHDGPQIQQFTTSLKGGGSSTSFSSQRYANTKDFINSPSGSFSVDFWVNGPSLGTDNDHAEILYALKKTGASCVFNIQAHRVDPAINWTVGQIQVDWAGKPGLKHVAYTYDAETSGANLYLNGVLESSVTVAETDFSDTYLEMGSASSNTLNVDEFVIYDVALGENGVATRYNNGLGNTYPISTNVFVDDNYDTKIGYGPHKPLQELVDNGQDLRTISFIYENTFGSGHRTVSSFENGSTPELHLFYSDVGTTVAEEGINSGLILHWDGDSYADRINNVCMGPGINDVYGIYGSGYDHDTYLNLPLRADNHNDRNLFVQQSSILHFSDTFSLGFWATPKDYRGSDTLSISALVSGDVSINTPQISHPTRIKAFEFLLVPRVDDSVDAKMFVFPEGGNESLNLYQGRLKGSGDIEKSCWNYYYGEYDHQNKLVGTSVNGNPVTSGNTNGTIIPNSGGLVIDAQNYKIDELSFWNRKLTDQERKDLYNHRFPYSYNKPSLKSQTLWPYEDVSFIPQTADAGAALYAMHCDQSGIRAIQNLEDPIDDDVPYSGNWGFPYESGSLTQMTPASGRFFSCVNEWHSPVDYVPKNCSFISAMKPGDISFKTGPIFVRPSSIELNIVGQGFIEDGWDIREPTQSYSADFYNAFLYDNSSPRKLIASKVSAVTDGILLSGIERRNILLDDIDFSNLAGFDLTDTMLSVRLNPGSTSTVPHRRVIPADIYAISVQIEGEVNIRETGLTLYAEGIEAVNSGIDLYTQAHELKNSGIDLYTVSHEVINSSIPLYTKALDVGTSGSDLYTFGAYLYNSSIPMYTYGVASDNSGIDLYTHGAIPFNSSIDLYTHGITEGSGSIPFFMEASISYGSGGFPLYMNSTANTTVYQARPMYISVNAEETGTGSIPFFLNSVSTADDTGYIPFYLESKADSLTKGTDMYLQNAFESGFKSQFLYVKGLGGLVGGSVGNGSMPLFIERIEGAENGMSMYLGVNSGDEQGVNMYTFGGTWSNSGVDLVIPSTIDTKNSGLNIFIGGF